MKEQITVTTRQAAGDFALVCVGALAIGAAVAAAEMILVAVLASLG